MDLETLCLKPREIRPFAVQLARQLVQYQVDVICGPMVEGAFIALLVAGELGCDFVYAERHVDGNNEQLFPVKYRLPKTLRSTVSGKRVAIVNDVINAGSAVLGAWTDLQEQGARVVAIGALLVLGEPIVKFAAEQKISLETLKQMPNNLWVPAKCPLCAAGEPIEIVGTS